MYQNGCRHRKCRHSKYAEVIPVVPQGCDVWREKYIDWELTFKPGSKQFTLAVLPAEDFIVSVIIGYIRVANVHRHLINRGTVIMTTASCTRTSMFSENLYIDVFTEFRTLNCGNINSSGT